MANKTMIDEIQSYGLIPVIKIEDPAQAEPLAKALCDGGLPAAEVTFRTAAAKEAIARMTKAFPDMLVGAGTVLTTKQVDEAVEAGAKFIVSPGLNPKVVSYCLEKGVPILPGCATPSDMEAASSWGLLSSSSSPPRQTAASNPSRRWPPLTPSCALCPPGASMRKISSTTSPSPRSSPAAAALWSPRTS